MASIKKAVPSKEKGMPIMGPACFINRGHSRPSSKDKTVPDTAPVAKKIATPLLHAMVMFLYTGLPVRSQNKWETHIKNGIAIAMQEKMMWNPNDKAICERAAIKSSINSIC